MHIFLQILDQGRLGTRGCVVPEEVFETCIDQGVVCCYSNKCNRWSTGQNRQARISGEGGREGERGGEGGNTLLQYSILVLVH